MNAIKYYSAFRVGDLTEAQADAVHSAMANVLANNMMVHTTDDDGNYETVRRGAIQDMTYLRPLMDENTVDYWLRMSAERMGMDPNELRIT